MEFPELDNYNIKVNLAVVSSDLRADHPNSMLRLVRLVETSPAHLLILVFEDPDSAVEDSLVDWILSDNICKDCKKAVSVLGRGMFAITHKGFVYQPRLSRLLAERDGYGLSSISVRHEMIAFKQEWLIVVCRFPPLGTKIPMAVCMHMMSQMDEGAVLVAGFFGNTGPQLRDLFLGRGSRTAIHQGWVMGDTDTVCSYPAYWVILAKHRLEEFTPTRSWLLPDEQQMMGLRPFERRPFKRALLPVKECLPPGSRAKWWSCPKNVGLVKAITPAFNLWGFGIYQLPLWLEGSPKCKKETQREVELWAAARRAKQAK